MHSELTSHLPMGDNEIVEKTQGTLIVSGEVLSVGSVSISSQDVLSCTVIEARNGSYMINITTELARFSIVTTQDEFELSQLPFEYNHDVSLIAQRKQTLLLVLLVVVLMAANYLWFGT